jgi:hypothetical protein
MHKRFQIHMFCGLSPSVFALAGRNLVFASCDDRTHAPSWDLKTDRSLMYITVSIGLSSHNTHHTRCLEVPRGDGCCREAEPQKRLQDDVV